MLRKKLLTYGLIITAIVAADFVKFQIFGFPALVNWESFAHPAWVLSTLGLFLFSIRLNRPDFWKTLFGVHTAVALAALLNHYLPFSEILTYNCMLFNFAFASLYLPLGQTDIKN